MADTRRVHRISKLKSNETDTYTDTYSNKSLKSSSSFNKLSSSVISATTSTKKRQVLIGRLSRSNSRSPPPYRNRQSRSNSRGRTVAKSTLSPLHISTYNNTGRNRTTLIIKTPRSPSPRSKTPPTHREKTWSKSRSRSGSRNRSKDDDSKSSKNKSKAKKSKSDDKIAVKDKISSSSFSKDKATFSSKDKDKSSKDKDSKKSKSSLTPNKQLSSVSSKLEKSLKSSSSKSTKPPRSPSPVKTTNKSNYLKSSTNNSSSSQSKLNKSEKKYDSSTLGDLKKKKKKTPSKSPRSRGGSSERNYVEDTHYNNRSRGSSINKSRSRTRSRTRSSSNEHMHSYGSRKPKYSSTRRQLSPSAYPKKGYSSSSIPATRRQSGYTDENELSGDEKSYDLGHPAAMYGGRYGGGRPYLGRGGYTNPNMMPPGSYGMPNSNRNQFYPPHMPPPHAMPPYMGMHNHKFGKFNKKYYSNMDPSMEPFAGPEGANTNYEGGPAAAGMGPPYRQHFMPRFNSNYRYLANQFNPHFNGGNPQHGGYPPLHHMNMKQKPFPSSKVIDSSDPTENNETGEAGTAATASSSPPTTVQTVVIDPELVNAVQEITTAIANATAAGKELTLTAEQQAILQKHQQLVHQQQVQQQNQINSLQNPLLAKNKFQQNYRLLGRNIFEPNKHQVFLKKRIKENTYYSRFIKQHPTNNLPLAFQKSVSLAEDKALEEKENQMGVKKSKKKRSKRSKKKKNLNESIDSMSDSESSSSESESHSSRSSDVNRSRSSSANSSSSVSNSSISLTNSSLDSESETSSEGEIKKSSSNPDISTESKKKLKKKNKVKKNNKKLDTSTSETVTTITVSGELQANDLVLPVNGDETTAVKKQRDHSASSSSSKTSNLSSSSGEIKPPQVIQTEAKKANNKKVKKTKTKKTKISKRNKSKHSLFESKSNSNNTNSNYDSDGSMLDLKENLRPIGAYIKDRERMLIEMFRCIKGAKLQAMLPDLLKNKPLKEIKAKCLDQLDIMSKKRIRCLLDDKVMTSSSGTDDSSDESDSSFNQSTNVKSNASPDNYPIMQEENKKAKFNKGNIVPKFKPIGFGEVNKSNELNKSNKETKSEDNEEYDENSQENDENQSESTTSTSQSAQQQQSGIAAAGFKKFVKKSISIKIKTNETNSNSTGGEVLNEKDEKTEKDKANSLLVQKHHISKINKAKFTSTTTTNTNNQNKLTDDLTNESNLNMIPQQAMSEAEKLRAQYNQYNRTQQQQQHLISKQPASYSPHSALLPTPPNRFMHPPPTQGNVASANSLPLGNGGYLPPPTSFSVPPPNINQRFQQPKIIMPGGMLPVNGPPVTAGASSATHFHHLQQQAPLINQNTNYMHHQMMPNNSISYHNSYQYSGILNQQQQQHNNTNNFHSQHMSLQNNNKLNRNPYIHLDDYEDDINVNINDDAAYTCDLDDYYNENTNLSDDQEEENHKNNNKSNNTIDYDYDLELESLNDLIGNNGNKQQASRSSNNARNHHHHHSSNRHRHRRSRDRVDISEEELDLDNDDNDDENDNNQNEDSQNAIIEQLKSKSKRRKQSSKSKSKRSKRKHLNSDDDEEDEEEVEQEEPNIEALKEILINVISAQIEDTELDEEIKISLNFLLSQVQEDNGSLSYDDLSNIHLKIKELLTGGETSDQNEDEIKSKRKKSKRSKQRSSSNESNLIDQQQEISLKSNKKKRKYQIEESTNSKKSSKDRNNKSSKSGRLSLSEVEAGEIEDVYDDQYGVDQLQDLLMK